MSDPKNPQSIDPAVVSELEELFSKELAAEFSKSGLRARSQDVILARITERAGADTYGFEREVYASYLTEENSLKANAPTKGYPRRQQDWAAMLKEMREFLVTAKAQAAQFQTFLIRAVHRYLAWSWLSGDELFAETLASKLAAGLSEDDPVLDEIDSHFGLTPAPAAPASDRTDKTEAP